MIAYANVHMALEAMRVRALAAVHGSPLPDGDGEEGTDPPRVLVLGPENSGKTSVCKILTNYAVRTGQDWMPMLVNVDPSEVSLFYVASKHLVVNAVCRAVGQSPERSLPRPFLHHCKRLRQHLLSVWSQRPLRTTCRRTHSCPCRTGTATPRCAETLCSWTASSEIWARIFGTDTRTTRKASGATVWADALVCLSSCCSALFGVDC